MSIRPRWQMHGSARDHALLPRGHRDSLEADQGFQDLDRHGAGAALRRPALPGPQRFRVEPIPLRHDGPTFGFRIESVARRKTRAVGVGYLADTGSWSDEMADSLADVDILGVEFNHDVAMQKASGRSPALIAPQPGRPGPSLEPARRPSWFDRSSTVKPRPGRPPGAASPQRAVQSPRAGHPRSARGRQEHRPANLDPRRAADPRAPEPPDRRTVTQKMANGSAGTWPGPRLGCRGGGTARADGDICPD